jgi:hypothetical protein
MDLNILIFRVREDLKNGELLRIHFGMWSTPVVERKPWDGTFEAGYDLGSVVDLSSHVRSLQSERNVKSILEILFASRSGQAKGSSL